MTEQTITIPQARFIINKKSETFAVDRWLEQSSSNTKYVATDYLHFVIQYRVEQTWIVSMHENQKWNDMRQTVFNALAASETSVLLAVFGGVCIDNEQDPDIMFELDNDDDPDGTIE